MTAFAPSKEILVMIRNVFAVFFMWFVMYLIGILNGTTAWVSLLIYIAFRYDVHSTSRNMLNGISEWFKDWWKKNGAPLWNKGKGKIPEGCMLIEDHKKICRKMEIEFKKKCRETFSDGVEMGRILNPASSPIAEDNVAFAYLFNTAAFDQKLNELVEKNETFMWYDYLGVAPSASEAEINIAFRDRANRHHPDRNPNNRISLHAFQKISDARDQGLSRKKSAQNK
jgi:hypothetical protein